MRLKIYMKKLLFNKVFLISIIGILVFLNIFCLVFTKTHNYAECPIYVLYTNGSSKEDTQKAEKLLDTMMSYSDIKGKRSYMLLTPSSEKYEKLVAAYGLSNKTNAMIVIGDDGKVLSYKYPIPSEIEVKKIMKALSGD